MNVLYILNWWSEFRVVWPTPSLLGPALKELGRLPLKSEDRILDKAVDKYQISADLMGPFCFAVNPSGPAMWDPSSGYYTASI